MEREKLGPGMLLQPLNRAVLIATLSLDLSLLMDSKFP